MHRKSLKKKKSEKKYFYLFISLFGILCGVILIRGTILLSSSAQQATNLITLACVSGLTSCNGSCVDLKTDVFNCGSCSHKCFIGAGQRCINGSCVGLYPSPTVSADPVIAAAGDSVCGTADIGKNLPCKDKETAAVIKGINPRAFLALGDEQYESGSYSDFMKYYDNPLSWGQFKAITYPVVGNHEYSTKGAAGYFQYFGSKAGPAGKGYYSFDIGYWHLIALNANCNALAFDNGHGCDSGSLQDTWLRSDLRTHPNKCTLAFMHQPFFTSGTKDTPQLKPLIQDLYNAHADLILAGHKHMYEQFSPQDPDRNPDPNWGIREIVVGTGGRDLTGVSSNLKYSSLEIRNATTFGVLQITLHPQSYDWVFKPIAGQTFTISGTGTCH